MDERLVKLKRMSRQYRTGDPGDPEDSIKKIWNRGMGRISFVILLEEEKKVLVNSFVARKRDYERVAELFSGYEIVKVEYGYPLYYSHSMLWVYERGYVV